MPAGAQVAFGRRMGGSASHRSGQSSLMQKGHSLNQTRNITECRQRTIHRYSINRFLAYARLVRLQLFLACYIGAQQAYGTLILNVVAALSYHAPLPRDLPSDWG